MKLKLSLLTAVLLFAANLVMAQSISPQQMELFKQLSPEQQKALIGNYSSDAGKVSTDVPETPRLLQPQPEVVETVTLSKYDILVVDVSKPISTNGKPVDPGVNEFAEEEEEFLLFQQKLMGKNIFTLNQYGELLLTQYNRIKLSGLNLNEAALKLMSTPELKGLVVTLSKLGNQNYSNDKLKPFGYDVFSGVPTSFAPATDIPVPVDYIIGPGDVVQITLFGSKNQEYNLAVSRDGLLNLPEIGPIMVAGLSFKQLNNTLQERISKQMIGIKASISLGKLRSIRVFVLGDVNKPGSYTVSSLSTMTNALLLSGGVKEIGSLRNIRLKRNGKRVGKLDLYDLLLRGDSSKDKRLLPGDVIFVPPVGRRVAVAGEVLRPALYETKNRTTVADILHMAGGFTSQAYPKISRLERINKKHVRTVMTLDLTKKSQSKIRLRDGDYLRIFSVNENKSGVIKLAGYVDRTGSYQWVKGMRLTKVISSVDELLPKTDLHYVLIQRESFPEKNYNFISIDLIEAFLKPLSDEHNPILQERDTIYLFSREGDRKHIIAPIIEELKNQAIHGEQAKMVSIAGQVRVPGTYPLEKGMRISDLIRAGGKLHESAYYHEAEITQYTVKNGENRVTEHININLAAILSGDLSHDLELKPYDHVVIKEIPQWKAQEKVTVRGEVKFPGEYTIKRGETLQQLIERVGGLTDLAFADGSVFMRKELQKREQEQMNLLATRLESDLSAMALEGSQAQDASAADTMQSIQLGKSLANRLRTTKAAGRMVIDLKRVINSDDYDDNYDVVLKDGDQLVIPKQTQEVTIIGEVQYATSHLYNDELNREDYINRSGGMTYKADADRIYVVRANGEVISSEQSSEWFSEAHNAIRPGDTIVVPLDAERMRPLTFWTNITQIFYQLGIAAAAWNTVGIF